MENLSWATFPMEDLDFRNLRQTSVALQVFWQSTRAKLDLICFDVTLRQRFWERGIYLQIDRSISYMASMKSKSRDFLVVQVPPDYICLDDKTARAIQKFRINLLLIFFTKIIRFTRIYYIISFRQLRLQESKTLKD